MLKQQKGNGYVQRTHGNIGAQSFINKDPDTGWD